MPFYKNDKERAADFITANSTKIVSDGNGSLVPASDYDKALHKEEKSAASARLAIDKAMTTS